jgi:erythromycin esterase-like protein
MTAAHARLTGLMRENARPLARASSARQTGFMRRIVDSLAARSVNLYERFGSDTPPTSDGGLSQENRRDACNADNLRWLLEQGYPDRKVIIWAHNAHVMNAYYESPGWKSVRLTPAANAMKPHGVYLADWLGRELYTLGFTAYEGEDGWNGLGASPIAPASEGSLEAEWKRMGQPYAFLDLRTARGPWRGPQTLRVPKYDEVRIPDARQPYDGLFFIAKMERGNLGPVA